MECWGFAQVWPLAPTPRPAANGPRRLLHPCLTVAPHRTPPAVPQAPFQTLAHQRHHSGAKSRPALPMAPGGLSKSSGPLPASTPRGSPVRKKRAIYLPHGQALHTDPSRPGRRGVAAAGPPTFRRGGRPLGPGRPLPLEVAVRELLGLPVRGLGARVEGALPLLLT